ncbi:hypothetical protein MSPP1_000009 [Malassezia sp. CBS 17886]|nr:hypothetical protein MSPP1_000009 [Malassezia sp. CBS 17886]
MRRSTSVLGGFLGWMSPQRAQPTAGRADDDGDDAGAAFEDASDTWDGDEQRRDPRGSARAGFSALPRTVSSFDVLHGSAPQSTSFDASPAARGERVPVTQSTLKMSQSMDTLAPRRPALEPHPADSWKRRRVDGVEQTSVPGERMQSPPRVAAPEPADPALAQRKRAAPEDAVGDAEVAEVPTRRRTRAAATMLSVLESTESAPAAPSVPEVVNPYQTAQTTRASPRRATRSTRAKALEAARERVAATTSSRAMDEDASTKDSLLDLVERTAPPQPRHAKRRAPNAADDNAAQTCTAKPTDAVAADPESDAAPPSMPTTQPEEARAKPARTDADMPAWCILQPPWKRPPPTLDSDAKRRAYAIPLDELPTFAFDVTPPAYENVESNEPKSSARTDDENPTAQKAGASETLDTSAPALSLEAEEQTQGTLPAFSFGAKGRTQTTMPAFSFGTMEQPQATAPAFSFGTKEQTQTSTPSFSPARKEQPQPTPAFSFNTRATDDGKTGATPGAPAFSFQAKSNAPTPPFSFTSETSGTLSTARGPEAGEDAPFAAKRSGNQSSNVFGAAKAGFSFGTPATQTVDNDRTADSSPGAEAADAEPPSDGAALLTDAGEGEENEKTLHEVRAKIWKMDDGKWQDLGISIFRLKKDTRTDKTRVLARNAVNGNVVLNFLLYAGMKVTRDKSALCFTGFVDANPCTLRCKVKTDSAAEALQEALADEARASA